MAKNQEDERQKLELRRHNYQSYYVLLAVFKCCPSKQKLLLLSYLESIVALQKVHGKWDEIEYIYLSATKVEIHAYKGLPKGS